MAYAVAAMKQRKKRKKKEEQDERIRKLEEEVEKIKKSQKEESNTFEAPIFQRKHYLHFEALAIISNEFGFGD